MVWLTTQTDPCCVSARSAAAVLQQLARPAHLVWNPVTGDAVQMVPITRAACGLASGRDGRLCVEIRVIGSVTAPFTAGPARGLTAILAWLDTWSVPRIWPAGTPRADLTPTDRRTWSRGGHFGGSQVPRAPEPGPGPIDGSLIVDLPSIGSQPRDWLPQAHVTPSGPDGVTSGGDGHGSARTARRAGPGLDGAPLERSPVGVGGAEFG